MTTDHIQVQDYQTVMDDEEKDLLKFIEELQSLRAQGYNRIRTDAYHHGDECYPRVKVSKTRLETDEEYKERLKEEKRLLERRRRAYEALRKEFGE